MIRSKSLDIGHGYLNPLSDDVREFTMETGVMETEDTIEHTFVSRTASLDNGKSKRKGARGFTQPNGTLSYIASNRDTVDSIALHYNTTPSELMRLNKLACRMIYPGQELFVPDPDAEQPLSLSPTSSSVQEFLDDTGPLSLLILNRPRDIPVVTMREKPTDIPTVVDSSTDRKMDKRKDAAPLLRGKSFPLPGKVVRQRQVSIESPPETEYFEKFLKINVKYITDGQGVVSGVLLVTPNAIMFDPNVSDPLVIENGADTYGIITPMDMVVSAAMYHDISPMIKKDSQSEIYHAENCPLAKKKKKEEETEEPLAEPLWTTQENGKEEVPAEQDHTDDFNANSSMDQDVFVDKCSCGVDSKPTKDSIMENGHTDGIEPQQTEEDLLSEIEKELHNGDSDDTADQTPSKDISQPGGEDTDTSKEETQCVDIEIQETDTKTDMQIVNNESDQVETLDAGDKDPSSLEKGSVESGIAEMNDAINNDEQSDVVTETGQMNTQAGEFTKSDQNDASDDAERRSNEDSDDQTTEKQPVKDTDIDTEQQVKDAAMDSEQQVKDAAMDSEQQVKDAAVDTELQMKDTAVDLGQVEDTRSKRDRQKNLGTDNTAAAATPEQHDNLSLEHRDVEKVSEGEETETKNQKNLSDQVGKQQDQAGLEEVEKLGDEEQKEEGTPLDLEEKDERKHRTQSFVDFSSGLFAKDQDPTSPILDISEVIRDTSATQQEIERIKASARRIRITPRHRQKSDSEFDYDRKERTKKQLERLASWDTNYQELLLRPKPMDEPPLYLCLKVGKPMKKTFSTSGAIESYSNKTKKPEYWFAVPRDRADHLYAFFVQWSPNIYGKENPDAKEMGFVVLEEEDAPLEIVEDFFNDPVSKDWEIVTYEEAKRRLSLLEGEDLPLPELIGKSNLLDNEQISKLMGHLPPRVEGYSWSLIYSTYEHGFSLKTLYRSMDGYESPVLLVVKDADDQMFGALLSTPIKVSDHFYGTGETFVYMLVPEFRMYPWTGENNFFIKGDFDSLAIGGGDGNFGLWLDGDIYHGRSHACSTFDNGCLSCKEDFVVQGLEAWGFV
ncbi:oxidation resistance protein 1-like isoform X2 [Glandiceps talaboti]